MLTIYLLVLYNSCETIDKRQLRFHGVDFLAFTAGYARKDAQVHADMRLVRNKLQLL